MPQQRRPKGPGGGRYAPWNPPEAKEVALGDDIEDLLEQASAEAGGSGPQPPPPKDEAGREERLADTLAEMARAMDAAARIVADGPGTLTPFTSNRLAAERLVEIVAEQSKRLPERFRGEHIETEWGPLVGMRNRISHGYGEDVDSGLLWDALSVDLPRIRRELGI